MKFLVKLILPFVKNHVLEEITNPENKTWVVAKLNANVDLPELTEPQEQEVIENLYNAITVLVKSYLQIKEPTE